MNVWQQFKKLLPSDVILAGTVQSIANGVYTISLAGGRTIPARSPGAYLTGANVFVRNGQVIGTAPNLGAITTIEI